MRRSIFFKYFSITAAIQLVSIIIFSLIVVVFSRTQWLNDKNDLLVKNTKIISNLSNEAINLGWDFKSQMKPFLVNTAQQIDASVYIYDLKGGFVLCSDLENNCTHKLTTIKQEIVDKAANDNFSESGTMGGLYTKNCYTVGKPIYYNGQTIGVVFASVPSAISFAYVSQIIKVMLICSLVVMMIAVIAIYIASAQMTKPLRLMAQAAKNMEKGIFLQNIPVENQDEVGLLAQAFNKMSKSLGSLEQMRRSFISSISHELKTPMTTISGFVDGVLDGTIPRDEHEKYLKIVSSETHRLSRLVNSMLQLSRLENDGLKLNPAQFNISDMLMRILFSFEQKINDKNLDIQGLEKLETVNIVADNDLIYQVLYNLLENAIKFTNDDGYISFNIEKAKHNTIKIRIKNSGEGLSQVELSRIFERFYKTDRSRSIDKTGMGFGLYIVKTIVAAHNGKIVVSSVLNEYTCFDLTLPEHYNEN